MHGLGQRGICISANVFEGVPKVHIRKYIKVEEGKMVPTRKGITLNVDEWNTLKAYIDRIDSELARVQAAQQPPPAYVPLYDWGLGEDQVG